MAIITWRTRKLDENRYEYQVYSFEYHCPEKILTSGECVTRDAATRYAKRWTRWFKGHSTKAPTQRKVA